MQDFIEALLSRRKHVVRLAANFMEFTTIEMLVEALHSLIRRVRFQIQRRPALPHHVNQEYRG
jgi:hypothetical protein